MSKKPITKRDTYNVLKMGDYGLSKLFFPLGTEESLLLVWNAYEQRHQQYLVLFSEGLRKFKETFIQTEGRGTIGGSIA